MNSSVVTFRNVSCSPMIMCNNLPNRVAADGVGGVECEEPGLLKVLRVLRPGLCALNVLCPFEFFCREVMERGAAVHTGESLW